MISLSTTITIFIIGCVLIASYDILGSIISRKFNFQYVWLTLGSFYLYGLIALYLKDFGNIQIAIVGSFLLGVFDATIGLIIADKFNANIKEVDKEIIRITPQLVFTMGIIASVIGIIAILIYK